MAKIVNDDALWRYQPRFIDMRGWTVPGQPTYASLGLALAALPFTFIPARLAIGGVWGLGIALGVALIIGYALSSRITAERGLIDYVVTASGEIRSALYAAKCRRVARRQRPVTYTYRKVPT